MVFRVTILSTNRNKRMKTWFAYRDHYSHSVSEIVLFMRRNSDTNEGSDNNHMHREISENSHTSNSSGVCKRVNR